ncbi:class I SAM-dependent methyltransferase [Fusibacter sp. JL216-2]|uniref:class I SAM-dependent methyltransferase n=1 Tax=Fusibacter sp. JL216-2 TaxID=3071453 RepID=UPI003D34F4FD
MFDNVMSNEKIMFVITDQAVFILEIRRVLEVLKRYLEAINFFEVNMIKDHVSDKMCQITEMEVAFLNAIFVDLDSCVLDVMCGYGRHASSLSKRGYKAIDGIDLNEYRDKMQDGFNFILGDFYTWEPDEKYKYIYSLYNSYSNRRDFQNHITKCMSLIDTQGIFIVDVFNRAYRERFPRLTSRTVFEDREYKIELAREYHSGVERSIYKIVRNDEILKEFDFSQIFLYENELEKLMPSNYDYEIITSSIAKTRSNDEKIVVILKS